MLIKVPAIAPSFFFRLLRGRVPLTGLIFFLFPDDGEEVPSLLSATSRGTVPYRKVRKKFLRAFCPPTYFSERIPLH